MPGSANLEGLLRPFFPGGAFLKGRKYFRIIFILLGFVLAFSFIYQPVLRGAAGYLAPFEDGKAEAVILEGTQMVRYGALIEGKAQLAQGKARRLVVVLHRTSKEEAYFALPADYPQLVKKGLERSGLRPGQWLVIVTPVMHPITLTEARFVLAELAGQKVRSAILIAEGFHTRRSIGVYRGEGKKWGIRIFPHPYYISYQKENWWVHAEGVRAFVTEYLKLCYYFIRGYM